MTLDDLERLLILMRTHGATHVDMDGTRVVLGGRPRAVDDAVPPHIAQALAETDTESAEDERARAEYDAWLHGKGAPPS